MTKDQFKDDTKGLMPGDRVVITYRPLESYRNKVKMTEPITKDGVVDGVDEENIVCGGVSLYYKQIIMLRV